MTNDTSVTESQRLIRQLQTAHKKRYAKAVALIVIAVLAGMVIGAGGTVLYFKNKMHRVPPHPKAIGEAMIGHMRELRILKPGEEAGIKAIIDEHVGEVDALRKASYQEIRGVFGRMNEKLEAILGPERMKLWQDDKERRYGKRGRGDDRHRGPPR